MEFRKLDSFEDMLHVKELDETTWGVEPTSLDQTLTAVKNGGLLIGAFDGRQLVGYSYGFPGVRDGETYLFSHKLAVHSEFRDRNIGYQLKRHQATMASELGYQRIRWTYDPLEARNAYLNIAKLGAVCSEYIENCYGVRDDKLSAGLPTDRFNVDWVLEPKAITRVEANPNILSNIQSHLLMNWQSSVQGLPEPVLSEDWAQRLVKENSKPEVRYVPIPRYFQTIKQLDFPLAIKWRFTTRQVFLQAFAAGWTVTGCVPSSSSSVQIYVLTRKR